MFLVFVPKSTRGYILEFQNMLLGESKYLQVRWQECDCSARNL